MKILHARVHDIRKRITQQEVSIELRCPVEAFADVVDMLDDADVIVHLRDESAFADAGIPYGIIKPFDDGDDDDDQ